MTTIVYRDGVLAGDSLFSEDTSFSSYGKKVFKEGDYLIGFCGDTAAFEPFKAYVREGFNEALLKELAGSPLSYSILLIPKQGKMFYKYDKELGIYREEYKKTEYKAEGTGESYAIGALASGADAITAVKVAMQIDLYTGGKVFSVCH